MKETKGKQQATLIKHGLGESQGAECRELLKTGEG